MPCQTHRYPKCPTAHFIALKREEIHLHPPEHRLKLPQPGKLNKPLLQPYPQGPLHNKEEPLTSSLQKGHTHSNQNKIKRQRNIQQVKEHDKYPANQTKEEEIRSLPEKEFRIMIVKMIQNLTTIIQHSFGSFRHSNQR